MGEQRGRRWGPVVVPLALAAVIALFGPAERALVLAALAGFVAVLIGLGVDVAGAVERGAHRVGRGLSVVLGTVVFLVIVGPAWTWTRIARRDPFSRGTSGPTWTERSGAPAAASLGSAGPATVPPRTLTGRLSWAVGCVVLLLAANYGLGWAWDTVRPAPAPAPATYDEAGATQTPPPGGTVPASTMPPLPVSSTKYDPRADLPAMAAYPWRDRYFQDLQRPPSIFWPYTQYRPMPFASPYINIDGWSRRSYRTPGPTEGRPVVWMFGGSTAWGEGQRDEYTIASMLARYAEDAGTPIEIRNYGQRGWTHFQEMVLYEQLLANEGVPDLALFYDGANETLTESLVPEAVPSHYDVGQAADAADGKAFATRFAEPPDAGTALEDAWYAYSEHSLAHKVARWFSAPAGASPAEEASVGRSTRRSDDEVESPDFDITEQDGIDAGQVYMRIQRLTRTLSEEHDVPTLFYWQPYSSPTDHDVAARAQIGPPTIDIAELLLDHREVYIDGAHTNEEGARIVAERMWEDLGPEVEAWYAANG